MIDIHVSQSRPMHFVFILNVAKVCRSLLIYTQDNTSTSTCEVTFITNVFDSSLIASLLCKTDIGLYPLYKLHILSSYDLC